MRSPAGAPGNARDAAVQVLWRDRPRNWFLRISVVVLLLLVAVAWTQIEEWLEFSPRRLANVQRFLHEATPGPLRDGNFTLTGWLGWAWDSMAGDGWTGALATLSISVAAIVLAMILGLLLCFPAARNLATAEPWLPASRPPSTLHRWAWRAVVGATRAVQIFLRAIPEYMWAFLIIAMLGPTTWPWPAVLALGLHNAGILGRLTAETVENTPPGTLAALRAMGASRRKVIAVAILPACFPRFLLYFFYRWETCVREATVLGMVGATSLGFLIKEARVGFRYDDMVLLILVGSLIVILGDFLSAWARRMARLA